MLVLVPGAVGAVEGGDDTAEPVVAALTPATEMLGLFIVFFLSFTSSATCVLFYTHNYYKNLTI